MPAPATVLIADDQATMRDQIAEILRAAGFRVLLAADGVQALATARREQPDVIVLDLVMPQLDGIGVCRALRSDPVLPYVPILFLSRRAATADRVNALRAGGDDFVGKDVDGEELVARIETLLRVKRMLEQRRRGSDTRPPGIAAALELPDAAAMEERVRIELERASAHNQPLSLVLVLAPGARDVAGRLSRCARAVDQLGRWKGDGWALLLPGSHFGGAMAAAERIWRALPPEPGFAGVSVGVSCYPATEVTGAAALVELAGAALERARDEGPGHICLFHHQAYLFRPA
ncbi:MAG TPA: response regulator [Kofleriaceae bacterium]|nr:response regulator [Kofleriaceae bacterium]